ncbi:MAG: DUF1566 domain-containing protein [Crocinitomicaceae bacterium]|nr:DUF1566 domain-containing protein [Crocinitomicaceae bacterium]
MKKIILSLVAILTISLTSFGQAPEGFKYQAVVRDASNTILNNQAVGLRMTIQQGSIGGTTVYQETFAPITNAYGLVNLEIGTGTVVIGDFSVIDWSVGPYFIETAVDVTGGSSYAVMGTSQLMSVPYALYANTAENVTNDLVDDADPDPNNEIQLVSFSNDTLYLSNGGQVYLGTYGIDLVDDADSDPTNEIQTISRVGTTVTLSNGGGTFEDSIGVYAAGTGIDITNNVISTSGTCGFAIGDTYQGGIIFYLDPTGCHGLISAPSDQSTGAQWYNGSFIDVSRGNGSGMFEGKYNTPMINEIQGGTTSAAAICANLSIGGYNDWYLPSIEELNRMYQNIGQGNTTGLGNVGGFASDYYWSSTEFDNNSAWLQFFNGGGQLQNGKNLNFYVRAVRAF